MQRVTLLIVFAITPHALASDVPLDPDAVARGRDALTTRSLVPASWNRSAFANTRLQLGPTAPDPTADPEGFAEAFRARYGLHPAPYPNDGLPMGLRPAEFRKSDRPGLHIDCLVCHGGSIGGTSYVGLGNTQLDLEALLKDLTRADGRVPPPSLFTINSTRGTNNAGMIDVALLSLRNPDLSFRKVPVLTGANLPELDTPAWWHLKKKKTKYYDGRTPADAVRSNMQFLLGSLSRKQFEKLEPTFQDLDQYLRSLEAPKYPFEIDSALANQGKAIFEENCARCHGTYGAIQTYPNKIVPLAEIGTDPARARGLSDAFVAHYNASWFGERQKVNSVMTGYQAPPLDGIWATAPYLHNGSVPTLATLLNSPTRPARFTRPTSTDFANYDTRNVGWKFDSIPASANGPPRDADPKRIVDTTRFGLGNQGHIFGDDLTDDERRALIEYLKTL